MPVYGRLVAKNWPGPRARPRPQVVCVRTQSTPATWPQIAAKAKNTDSESRSVIFQLWDCLLNWMERAAPVIEKSFANLPPTSVWIEIDVTGLEKWSDHAEANLVRPTSASPYSVADASQRTVIITIPPDFRNAFHVPENRAERTLVGCAVTAIAELAGAELSENDRVGILSAIFPNNEARFFHVVRTENLTQMVAGTGLPAPDFVPEEDCAQSLIGLAEEVGAAPAGGKIQGEAECLQYLQKVADKLWQRIEKGLAQFNRQAVVTSCFHALAELERDAEHWNMTARALLALQKDETEVLQRAEERRGKRDAASLTNRLLIETAMYACP